MMKARTLSDTTRSGPSVKAKAVSITVAELLNPAAEILRNGNQSAPTTRMSALSASMMIVIPARRRGAISTV